MNYPSLEFDTALAGLCHGTATDAEVGEFHAALRESESAQDAYLWYVELHSHLASLARSPATIAERLVVKQVQAANRNQSVARRTSPLTWVAASAIVLVLFGVTGWMLWHSAASRVIPDSAKAPRETEKAEPTVKGPSRGSMAGIYRDTVQFAYAADAPVIVVTGRKDPLKLGAEIPYSQSGDTLHFWDWSKSPLSQMMPGTRLWPHEIFALSPDGKQFVWANGTILELASGTRSRIDLGGDFYHGNAGGSMERIVQLQFTPGGKRLAVQFLEIVLTKSTHPLRKQDFDTKSMTQLLEFPSGKLVCEFPAGLSPAFSPDGKRIFNSQPMREMKQQVVELDASTGKETRTFQPRLKGFPYAMCLSPTDNYLAVFDSEGELLIWDAATGELKHRRPLPGNLGAALRISPSGKRLAVSDGKNLSIVDLTTGSIVATIPQFVRSIMIQWSPDSQTVTSVRQPYMHESDDPAGPYNVLPTVENFKIDDYLRK